jgi:hypothetical protein
MKLKSIIYFLVALLLFSVSCKRKKHVVEELPVQVKSFKAPEYQKSSVDSLSLIKIKTFGSEYDSMAYQIDIDSISNWVLKQKWEESYSTPSGVVYHIEKFGNGDFARLGDRMHVHTETQTLSGKKFFSSYDLKQPIDFVLGVGQVMPAWDEVLPNYPEGTEATIISPSALAYGKKGIKKVLAPNMILVTKIKVVKVIHDKENPTPINGPGLKIDPKKEEENSKIPISIRKPSSIR